MDRQSLDLDHQELLRNLDKLEKKLQLILDFYMELGILCEKRKYLAEALKRGDQTEPQLGITTLKKTVLFDKDNFIEIRRSTRVPINSHEQLEKKKSVQQVYEFLGNLTSYHENVNKRISELKILKSEKRSDTEELDKILANLQKEKDDIDEKIIRFVTQSVVEGRDELFNLISMYEKDNQEKENTIIYLGERIIFLKGTIAALMLENEFLKKGEGRRQSDVFRKEVMKNISLIIPEHLRRSGSSDLETSEDNKKELFDPDDNISVERSTRDSFELDAAMATWDTDEVAIHDHVRRIGRNLEVMEVNDMKLNLLKRYIQKHGLRKSINRNTLIDPSNGMGVWISK